jgi:hypothetical protein
LKHADPRTLEARFTIGQVLALAWRACLACRWHILLLVVPSALATVGVRWLTYSYIAATVPIGWHEIVLMWQSGLIQSIAYVSMVFAAQSYMRGQRPRARDVLRFPWRRLPVAFGAGVVLTGVTWWPEPLLDWNFDDDYGIALDYAILTINVLTIDVLTFVLLPVLVIETRSLVATLRRCVHFAARHPWRILAIDIGLWCTYFLFSDALAWVYSRTDPEWASLVWSSMVTPWVIFSMSAGCFVITAAYHLIRNEQEGPAPEALARVFD